jgi:hypothetical protein
MRGDKHGHRKSHPDRAYEEHLTLPLATGTGGTAAADGCARPARTRKAHSPGRQPRPHQARTRALTRRGQPAPPGGYGTWTLTLPGGRNLDINLTPVPVSECDHRHESAGHQPNDTLRHLVQVRDGTRTSPTCTRHARESDFEHAIPYDKGGRTYTRGPMRYPA